MPKFSDFTHADFELHNEVINRVIQKLVLMGSLTAAQWLSDQCCESGLPMIVKNTSSTFHRIQKYWRTATVLDPSIRECGPLVCRAFRNGDRSQVFYISDEEAYNPAMHAVAAETAFPSPSLSGPRDRPMTIHDILPPPTAPGWLFWPETPPGEAVIKQEETPAAPTVDVSYSATIKIAGDTQVIPFTAADKEDVMKTVEDYAQFCREGNSIKYSTFALARTFMAQKQGDGLQ